MAHYVLFNEFGPVYSDLAGIGGIRTVSKDRLIVHTQTVRYVPVFGVHGLLFSQNTGLGYGLVRLKEWN